MLQEGPGAREGQLRACSSELQTALLLPAVVCAVRCDRQPMQQAAVLKRAPRSGAQQAAGLSFLKCTAAFPTFNRAAPPCARPAHQPVPTAGRDGGAAVRGRAGRPAGHAALPGDRPVRAVVRQGGGWGAALPAPRPSPSNLQAAAGSGRWRQARRLDPPSPLRPSPPRPPPSPCSCKPFTKPHTFAGCGHTFC